MLLLMMYLAPFLAFALFVRAQAAGAWDEDAARPGAWATLRAAVEPRLAVAAPVLATLALATVAAWCAAGLAGAIVLSLGVAGSSYAAALVHGGDAGAYSAIRKRWRRSLALAQTIAAIQAGSLGALAWFYADPAGAIVLVVFATGASAALLFVRVAASSRSVSGAEGPPAAWAMSSHLAAFAAAVMVAAYGEAASLLPLGGLLAETETLRSELLLVPIAVTLLSPLASAISGLVAPGLLERSDAASFAIERVAALAMASLVLALVHWSGLSWTVAWSLLVGLAARQVAGLADEAAFRGGAGSHGIRSGTSAMPAIVAAVAMGIGEALAGIYGIALVALGMTSTFVAAGSSGNLRGAERGPALTNANATTAVSASLAVIAALAPVFAATSLRGSLPDPSDTIASPALWHAAPALLAGVVAGAASAGSLSLRLAAGDTADERVRSAAHVVASAALLPMIASLAGGSAAATGTVLGFVAWAAGSRVVERGPGGFGRPVLLAWGRVMALFTLMSAPWMR